MQKIHCEPELAAKLGSCSDSTWPGGGAPSEERGAKRGNTAMSPCVVAQSTKHLGVAGRSCRPPKEVGATNRLRQAGTQFPLAAKIRCCQSGARQAAVGPRGIDRRVSAH